MSAPASQRTLSKQWLLTSASMPLLSARSCAQARRQAGAARERLDEHDVADLAALDARARLHELGLEAAHVADLQHAAGLLGGRDHVVALARGERHRLLAEHVQAGAERLHGEVAVA